MKKTLLLGVASLMMSMGFAQVDCNIANMQGGFAGGYLGWELGQGGIYAFIDPADDYAIGESCGASYPYTINTVDFTLADAAAFGAGDGIGTFEYTIGIYALDGGDPCNPPGAQLGSSGTISVNLDGSATYSQSVTLDVDVNDAFYVSFEPISWTGTAGQVPSILWDGETRPLCLQQFTQDGGETWVDHNDFFTEGGTGWADFSIFGTSDSGSAGDCEAGTIEDTTPLELCPDEEGVFSVGGTQEIPAGHAYGLSFNPTTGTGALEGQFELTGVSLPYTFDADLGGTLSGNGFPPFEGEWEISGIVYDDPDDIENTTCSQTTEVIVVNFLTADDPECDGGGGDECTDWVNPTATTGWTDFNGEFGGAPCNDGDGCPFLEIDAFEVWESEAYAMDNCVAGGSYTFSHCNGPGAGSWTPDYTIIAPSGAIDASGAGDGDGCSITWTASEDGTYLIVINEEGACGVEGSTDNGFPAITCNGTPPCDGGGDECTDWVNPSPTTGWSDLNTEFGGAPCNDGDGCPFNEIDAFEVWQSEAYALDNCVAGGSYTFSHCNGSSGSWTPDYTIIAPSGAIDASGAGDGDGCSITWTASEDGTYLIVINEEGACGVEGTTDNGFPAITCNGTPPCDGGGDECTDWVNPSPTTGWSDLNTEFGGAPCNDGDGCPFNEIDAFEVWQSEAYALDNCVAGGSYTFSHCNGSSGSWTPDYTIIAPSGAIDASGAGDGDGCSITWTASEDGTYLIVINEEGACGVEGSTDNGFPAITCNGTPPCPGAPANDDCANAEPVTPGTHDFSTVAATTDGPDQPGSDCENFGETNLQLDVWYEYTATCDGTATMSTCGTASFDTRLGIYPAGTCPPDGGSLIACNDDGVDGEGEDCALFTSVVTWDITEGETYLLRIGGFDDTQSGTGEFSLTEDCITSVDEQQASFSVFPNPNNGQFALEFAGENGVAQIDVLDVSGKAVHSEQRMMTSGARMDIDLGNVSGMYFVRMTMNNNVQMLKVIVQ